MRDFSQGIVGTVGHAGFAGVLEMDGASAMTLEIRSLNMLDAILVGDLDKAHETLASGVLLNRDDAAASGMNCASVIGRIAGLKSARAYIQQVEDELMGRNERKKKTA